jgi:cyclic pyranopterin phosphate synthase
VGSLRDSFGRSLDYLRVSVTDRCNLRCVYCIPAAGIAFKPREGLLSPAEIERIVRVASGLGVRKVRLTGGEPLVRPELIEIVARLGRLGLEDLSLSTNGVRLLAMARSLKTAGLDRVNVSLDTLRAERFCRVTRLGEIGPVLEGIEAALEAGLSPVKLNVVVMRGINEDEIADFVRLARLRPLHVRFIELMPIGETDFFSPARWVPRAQIQEACGELQPVCGPRGFGPASYFQSPGGLGSVGFISALSCNFCSLCNRLRLTAQGRLLPCLASQMGVDLRPALRGGASDSELAGLMALAARIKPERHTMGSDRVRESFMCSLGG